MPKKPHNIMFFTNGNHMVFDEDGQQIPEFQGSKELTVKALKADSTIGCKTARWGEWSHNIRWEEMILLLGGELDYPGQPQRNTEAVFTEEDNDGSEKPNNPESP